MSRKRDKIRKRKGVKETILLSNLVGKLIKYDLATREKKKRKLAENLGIFHRSIIPLEGLKLGNKIITLGGLMTAT